MVSHFCFFRSKLGNGSVCLELTLDVKMVPSASAVTLQISSVVVTRKGQRMSCKHSTIYLTCEYCTFQSPGIPLLVSLAPIQSVISCIRTELPGSLRSRDFKNFPFRTSLRFRQP
jgi:hypothetical protein